MKPLKTFGLLLRLLAPLPCLVAMPATAQVNYVVSGDIAFVTNSPNASGNIVVASTYNGYPVTGIEFGAFAGCTSLTNVTIPNSVTTIGNSVFSGCTSLTNVILGSRVTHIGNGAFSGCTNLTQIAIPDSVITIGGFAFFLCTGLTNVTIGNSVTNIGPDAFRSCTSLANVTIPNSVISIGPQTFLRCTSLTNVTLPDSITAIGSLAFAGCGSLTQVTIPDSVTSIGSQAFASCTNLTQVTIPNSVINIGSFAFDYCFGLTNFSVDAANSVYSSFNGVLFNKAQTTLIAFPPGRGGNYVIPDSVTNIGPNAFSVCTNLTNVTIPNSVTSVEHYAFWSCTRLTSVTIPTSVNSIGSGVFAACTNLTNFTFLGNAPSLANDDAFDDVGPSTTIRYYYGSTGWGPLYGGLPTVMLGAPAPQFGAGTAGVKPGGFGFTITSVVNQTIVVEASTNLTTWHPVWTNTLSAVSTNFVDLLWLNHPRRFYRTRSN
jgi:hypothetical protein